MATHAVATERRTSLALAVTIGLLTGLIGVLGNAVAMIVAHWTGWFWWLAGAALALVVSVAQALIGSHVETRWTGPTRGRGQELPARKPKSRGTPVWVAVAVLVALGLVGTLLTFGARYAIGYATGDEPGVDRLATPVTVNAEGLEVTVETFEETRHFTRLKVRVHNGTSLSQRISLFENCALVGGDGTALEVSQLRSDWTDETNPGVTVGNVLIFKGHLPNGVRRAQLQFNNVFALGTDGPDRVTVSGIELRKRE